MPAKSSTFARMKQALLAQVALIPSGRIATIGDVAASLNIPPRHVAYILASLTIDEAALVPWFRVVPTGGKFPVGAKQTARQVEQLGLLAAEGVMLDNANMINDLEAHKILLPDTHEHTFWADEA